MEDYDRGRAGTHYARTVQGKQPQPPNALPDPGLVFDTLLKARDVSDQPSYELLLGTALTTSVLVQETSRPELVSDIRLRLDCHALPLPYRSQRLDQEQHFVLS